MQFNTSPLIIPDKIGLYLSPSYTQTQVPEIVMTVFAGNGCDQVGELQVAKDLKLNQQNIYTKGGRIDILEVQINGYEFKKAPNTSSIACPAILKEARAVISLADVMTNRQLQLRIILNKNDNIFDLNNYDGVIYLNPVSASQVISWSPSDNMPDKPQYLGYMTKEFTNRLAKIRVEGSYAIDSNLATQLREFTKTKGLQSLDEKIQGYYRQNPLEDFIVFAPKDIIIPDQFKIIGECSYHEKIAGDKTIQVGITKAIVNPFFVRYNH